MDGNIYRCVVSGTCNPSATTTNSTLSVEAAPNVTSNPSDVTICEGTNTSFAITATGDNLTFQWQVDPGTGFVNASGAVYSGITSNTLTITGATAGMDAFDYRCVVSNTSCADDISGIATLTVQEAPNVTSNPSNATICENTNTSFSVTASGDGLSYQWQVDPGTGFVNASGAVYSGITTATL